MLSERLRMIRFLAGYVVPITVCFACTAWGADKQAFENFVRREGDVLKDGDREFRFLSFNIPNLHYVEDDMRFEQSMPFRLPDAFEIDDALGSIEQMGGQVVRTYTLAVKKADDPPDLPRYILGPGQFNEEAFKTLDAVIAAAHRHRVRLIIPLVDQWTRQIAAHIKSLDPQHLVLDGTHREGLLPSSLEDANIDFVQTHHYEKDPRAMIGHILESAKMAKGKKPYFVGEFGFLGTEALCAVLDTVRDQKLTGALLWSLRSRPARLYVPDALLFRPGARRLLLGTRSERRRARR